MTNSFDLPVIYKGAEINFPVSLVKSGYTYKIQVNVYGKSIFFEPDEESNFRAVIDLQDFQYSDKIDKELLNEIAYAIAALVNDRL